MIYIKKCKICNKKFETNVPNKKYCDSEECKRAAQRLHNARCLIKKYGVPWKPGAYDERMKEYMRNFYLEKKEKLKEYQKTKYHSVSEEEREKRKEYYKEYWKNKKETLKEKRSQYIKDWTANNKDKLKGYMEKHKSKSFSDFFDSII